MSVYKHNYRAYAGEVTPVWTRVLVLARYAFAEAWSSKITVALFTLSLLPVIVFLIVIYVANNPIARALIVKGNSTGFEVDARYFFQILQTQSMIALAITAWVAPRLICSDLSDNALPILLSHPISRFGYVSSPLCLPLRGFPACCSSRIRDTRPRNHGLAGIFRSVSESLSAQSSGLHFFPFLAWRFLHGSSGVSSPRALFSPRYSFRRALAAL